MGRRQAYVEHGGLDGRVGQRRGQLVGVLDRGDDLVVVRLEDPDQAVPEEGVVLGEDESHGTSSVTRVGPPVGLDTLIVPSNAASRRATPRIPVPDDGSAPPRPSSPTTTVSSPGRVRELDPRPGRLGVLGDVGQALGHGEVRRRLDRRRAAPAGASPVTSTGTARSSAERLDRRLQPAVGQHRRVDAVDDVAQVAQRGAAGLPRLGQHLPGVLGVALEELGGHPEGHPEAGQPRLRAVVQVALDPSQLGGGVVEALAAGLGERLDPLLEPLGRAEGQEPPVDPAARRP